MLSVIGAMAISFQVSDFVISFEIFVDNCLSRSVREIIKICFWVLMIKLMILCTALCRYYVMNK